VMRTEPPDVASSRRWTTGVMRPTVSSQVSEELRTARTGVLVGPYRQASSGEPMMISLPSGR
jgi:hypothetical protein